MMADLPKINMDERVCIHNALAPSSVYFFRAGGKRFEYMVGGPWSFLYLILRTSYPFCTSTEAEL